MPTFNAPSRCSSGTPHTFHWFDSSGPCVGDALDAATEIFLRAIDGPSRRWNPYNAAMARSEFRKRVELAAKGGLKPRQQVKPVDVRNPPPLYELRWQGISVTEVDAQSKQRHRKILVRMYHSEPAGAPAHFIGHHIEEKAITERTRELQDAAIARAKHSYHQGEASRWGIEL
ncbi:hypothetical protein [Rathayibacter sp. Leaf248]|uniref:hypothetical protein n=1 Tax=Rathayibacter sp. Leaf248 TaxID=2876555 RepID=UPI001E454310|nr:hypothetical protein [Rathayibacter sp. Leaf248]